MTRIGSQLTFCSPQQILRRTVVEQDEQAVVTQLFSLDNDRVESSHTLFFDGIISAEVISVKQHTNASDIIQLTSAYHYLDCSEEVPIQKIVPAEKPLLIDFGANSPTEINSLLKRIIPLLTAFSIYDLIASCTYYPALLLRQPAALTTNRCTQLLLWEGVDLVNKRITESTHIIMVGAKY